MFSKAFTGQFVELHEWTVRLPLLLSPQQSSNVNPHITGSSGRRRQNFVSATEFCFRGCKDGPGAPALCQHIYDVMGCEWNMPGNYGPGFDSCLGDSGEVIYPLRPVCVLVFSLTR